MLLIISVSLMFDSKDNFVIVDILFKKFLVIDIFQTKFVLLKNIDGIEIFSRNKRLKRNFL